jgi:hypothetical protein
MFWKVALGIILGGVIGYGVSLLTSNSGGG